MAASSANWESGCRRRASSHEMRSTIEILILRRTQKKIFWPARFDCGYLPLRWSPSPDAFHRGGNGSRMSPGCA
jgi:hypothetical protein